MGLGTKIEHKLFDLIGKKITLNDLINGPIEVEILDIVQGNVLYEHYSGEISSIPVEEFKELMEPYKRFD
jgi:hypothetical protein